MGKISSYFQPAMLHRYRSLDNDKLEREILTIEGHTLHCALYHELNDPMEGAFARIEHLENKAARKGLLKRAEYAKELVRICSFSETHNNEIMWAHYAKDFTGMCIEYRFDSLLSATREGTEFVRLSYRDKPPQFRTTMNPEDVAKRFLSCKTHRWRYEQEWRLFCKDEFLTYTRNKCVESIYLGARTSPANQAAIVKRMEPLHIRVRLMSLDGYSMSFSTIG